MIIDTHCHYNLSPLFTNWPQHWQKAQVHGVSKSIVVGADLYSSQQALVIATQEPNLFAAVGIHPEESLAVNLQNQLDQVKVLAMSKNPKLVAIGEIGLDYFRLTTSDHQTATIKAQQQLFQAQLEIANQVNLPAIIHVRDQEIPGTPTAGNAYWDTLQLIKVAYQFHKPFILHCVSGPLNYVTQALDMGAYIGVAGNVTYKNADRIREIVKMISTDRLLVETDAPYLPPQLYRGQTCEPWMIEETTKYLSANFEIDQIQLVKNAAVCFQLPR